MSVDEIYKIIEENLTYAEIEGLLASLKILSQDKLIERFESKLEMFSKLKSQTMVEADIPVVEANTKNQLKIGDEINFGNYPYDIYNNVRPIAWKVLDIKDGKALLLSKYGIDCKQYNKEYKEITWENCTLRNWLNNDFYNNAFNKEEQDKIDLTLVIPDKISNYRANQGNITVDKVFLLSSLEAERYFKSDEERKCIPTDYAKEQGAFTSVFHTLNEIPTCWYWLRSADKNRCCAVYVDRNGSINYYGSYVPNDHTAIRPTLWINI